MAGEKKHAALAPDAEDARAIVFRELIHCIAANAPVDTVAHVLLRVDVACRDAARARLAPLRPLLGSPFRIPAKVLVERVGIGGRALDLENRCIADADFTTFSEV